MMYLIQNYLPLFMFYLDPCIYSERLLNSLFPYLRLPARQPVCSSVCLSVCMHVTTRERLNTFKLNLLLKCFTINCPSICHYDRTALSAPLIAKIHFYFPRLIIRIYALHTLISVHMLHFFLGTYKT